MMFYLLILTGLVLFYFTCVYLIKVLEVDINKPQSRELPDNSYRLVLITKELDTPFWDKVKYSAIAAGVRNGANVEVWGSYNGNEQEFLKLMEIAIASKVDGIIVQGLDTEEFKQLSMYKATEKGIPIITVANDVPINDSLRKTYVGSNHYEAGQMLARQLILDMGFAGKVIIMASDRQEQYQRERLNGILDVLNHYEHVKTEIIASGNSRERVVQAMNQIMNTQPNIDGFITTTASNASALIQELGKRSQVEPYYIYSFDDSPETLTLLQQGKIDAIISQSPEVMGSESVNLMVQWLNGTQLPLNPYGYYTDVRVMKAVASK
ncbi:MAG: substrate-binding domain-containing protein [Candidatus Cohnella colombiensis]|uniref:Substrate-binding domain-containing protein n=1 Tax=Candidatus Cohnella colombiensis TaxID=3121368 RepID=A0AA95JC93_9BACL|nr:MAG: substrate-binding domain-containing protein [Cohnella sp.]